jgi:hypothetical protein
MNQHHLQIENNIQSFGYINTAEEVCTNTYTKAILNGKDQSAVTSTFVFPAFYATTEVKPYILQHEYTHKGIFEESISGVIDSIFSDSDKFNQSIW